MGFVIIILVLIAIVIILAVALVDDQDLALVRAFLAVLLFCTGIAICTIINREDTIKDSKKEQPKRKQEIVYSIKDGKYLPTDTIYIEIK